MADEFNAFCDELKNGFNATIEKYRNKLPADEIQQIEAFQNHFVQHLQQVMSTYKTMKSSVSISSIKSANTKSD